MQNEDEPIEEKLTARIGKPVLHDDQWGTATVVLAGLINSLKRVGRTPADTRAVILGSGASGIAIARTLSGYGLGDVVLVDRAGAIFRGRSEHMTDVKREIAESTNGDNVRGSVEVAIYDETLRFNVLLVDDLCLAQAYLPASRGVDSPTFVMRRQDSTPGLYPVYEQVFDSQWERGRRL